MFVCSEGAMYGGGDEEEISQEVIDEQFAIVLSRDYAGLLGKLLQSTFCTHSHVYTFNV